MPRIRFALVLLAALELLPGCRRPYSERLIFSGRIGSDQLRIGVTPPFRANSYQLFVCTAFPVDVDMEALVAKGGPGTAEPRLRVIVTPDQGAQREVTVPSYVSHQGGWRYCVEEITRIRGELIREVAVQGGAGANYSNVWLVATDAT
jgi:hypothetical protein